MLSICWHFRHRVKNINLKTHLNFITIMIIRMAEWHCQAALAEEAETLFSTGAVPILSRQPGFIHCQLLGIDNKTIRIALTAWENDYSYAKFVASDDMRAITDMFRPMYVDGKLPVGAQYRVLRASSN